MKTVTVMVVEDSAVARELLVDTLNSDRRIAVVAAVDSGEAAVRLAPRIAPDVISMDVRLPGMSGIEATRRIMETCPTPVIVVASDMSRSATAGAMEAIGAGALLVIEKPAIDSAAAYREMAKRLCDQFVGLSTLKVVRQRFNRSATARSSAVIPVVAVAPHAAPIDVVGVVASTGGPPAVASLLAGLGQDFNAPILLVQHMGAGFIEGFADWLGGSTGLDVHVARDGEATVKGRIYVGPGGRNLTYRGGQVHLVPAPPGNGHVPSGDALFGSLAAEGPRALGVLLTGMGEDGARGLLAMRQCGGVTIGQDQATSAVYGMPAAAKALGAVQEELPLQSIAPRILRLVARATQREPKKRAAI
jgi:two-component system, chemotaxis family, protein-glutamate methylesterase/glutaminase